MFLKSWYPRFLLFSHNSKNVFLSIVPIVQLFNVLIVAVLLWLYPKRPISPKIGLLLESVFNISFSWCFLS